MQKVYVMCNSILILSLCNVTKIANTNTSLEIQKQIQADNVKRTDCLLLNRTHKAGANKTYRNRYF